MDDRTLRIVAGISELTPDDPTLKVAAQVAAASGARLHLVHACQLPPLMSMSPGLQAAFPEGVQQYQETLLASLKGAAAAAGAPGAECTVMLGAAAPTLARVAGEARADLLIVGAARRSRLGLALLGTVAQRVLREATVPVLVARTPLSLPISRVLLTTDLSEFSTAVHDRSLDTIDLFFRTPRLVRSLLVLGWSAVAPPLTPDLLAHAARQELERFLADRGVAGPPVEPAVRTGITADEIVSEAREWKPDLLVLGTHARTWGARLMLGSVAEAVLRDAPCNVLAVPPMPTAAGAAPAATWNESVDLHRWLEATV